MLHRTLRRFNPLKGSTGCLFPAGAVESVTKAAGDASATLTATLNRAQHREMVLLGEAAQFAANGAASSSTPTMLYSTNNGQKITIEPAVGIVTDPSLPCQRGHDGALRGLNTVRGFKFETVAARCGPQDFLFAKQEHEAFFSFFSVLAPEPLDIAGRMIKVPRKERNFHVVCSRDNVPVDFFADVDFPKDNHGPDYGEKVLAQVLDLVEGHIAALKEEVETVVVLDGHSPTKFSYHIHIRMKDAAFPDYRAVREIALDVNRRLNITVIDPSPYRRSGMLRIAFVPKFNEPSRRELSLLAPRNPELKKRLLKSQALPLDDIMEMSLVHRIGDDFRIVKTDKPASQKFTGEIDEFGCPITEFTCERNKLLRFEDCLRAMRSYTPTFAENYETWIRIGISLHSFGHDDIYFQHWVQFSMHVMEKFDLLACKKAWESFAKRRNCYNWRRGFNYLTKTVFTSNGMASPQSIWKRSAGSKKGKTNKSALL